MGYKPFGKNRVLVLPVPASDMTAEEYKNAYGIELDSIEMRDLILLQEEGKEAYPVLYIDKENKVLYTADKAFSYASGFEVVEGDSLINKVIESGTIENAKPIYWHGIDIHKPTANAFFFHILNNSPTSFTTVAEIENWFKSIDGPVIASGSGAIKIETNTYPIYLVYKDDTNKFSIYYVTQTGYANTTPADDLSSYFTACADAMNKIN